ncbi:hypothetical protein ABID16_000791 [Rhizobium aquaticum]|uniref:Uncharacterized protein n=1 Tax=Rhizobium aquaticum TaxID=1549636 RepID=A0ABV2IVH2_9HYPH
MSKKTINISQLQPEINLPALKALSTLREGACFDRERDCRHPLGIYNLSIGKICAKIEKCAEKLELYWKENRSEKETKPGKTNDDIIDYIELCLYSAAEHVDDIEEIAKTFFRYDRVYASSKNVVLLKKSIKPLRDEISNFANTIKHTHGRIRLYETTFFHSGNSINLLGFFVEGWANGGVGPHPVLHSNGKKVLSITSFLWNILTYLADMSDVLANFLEKIGVCEEEINQKTEERIFASAATKLARLPIYSFDDDHPFNRVKWVFEFSSEVHDEFDSGIYGSLLNRWSKSVHGHFTGYRLFYAGDGTTKTFNLANPTQLQLQHWT